jgi:4-hydroxyphenylacetate 3-monooxygenase
MTMRTGADYRQALRDGRGVSIIGGGWIVDVTAHPATRPMVDEYVDSGIAPLWRAPE